jgi:nucleotide-binding universal stress UspA family protein
MKKIIWALDAFEESPSVYQHEVEWLRTRLARIKTRGAITVIPTFVMGPAQMQLQSELSRPWFETYVPAARKVLTEKLRGVTLGKPIQLADPQVLIQKRSSLTESVKTLLQFAKAEGASEILIGSHGRKGVDRLLLGSFAETLMLLSPIPVLYVGAGTDVPKSLKKILFPTDLSAKSQGVYRNLLRFAQTAKAEVILFHAIPNPIDPVLQSGAYLLGGGWIPAPLFLEKNRERAEKSGSQWIQLGKKLGVPVRFECVTFVPSVVEAVEGRAKAKDINMIAMAAQSGRLGSTLIGSIARQIVRVAPKPVWIDRAKKNV